MFFDGFESMAGGKAEAKSDKMELYNTLGVVKDASDSQIKKAYYNLAKKHHPDKGGDEITFKKIQCAFDVLKDKEKRHMYDKYGEAGLKGEVDAGGMNIFDLFTGGRRARKGKSTTFTLEVSLEEIYNQTTKKLKLSRNVVCEPCQGTGTKSRRSPVCAKCDGRGARISIQHISPTMMQQMQTVCQDCDGTGEKIAKNDVCPACKARKTMKQEKVIEVLVEKGVLSGHKITFEGEGDQKPGILAGDVIVIIKEKRHSVFARKQMNLYMKKCITLSEALCGVEFVVPHLDGRKLLISTKGTIVSPREVRCIENEGVPLHSRSFVKGALLIDFDIKFPSEREISDADLMKIKMILNQPSRPLACDRSQCEPVELVKKTAEEVEQSQKVYSSRDSDEEDQHMGNHTTCQAQ